MCLSFQGLGFGIWEFPKIRGYRILGVLIIRILLFRVLYSAPQPVWALAV